ncbi:Tripartite-type tricarboxylate transporter, receptor component TctC [Halobacillus dabanensis]|uniref:Tripartite-type tricarboxylate transporter, receptor component TctC n=1 Tax=Halobacillus dabanensis TaxID=240302 RepID=A0A1I3UC63_HALDA|nr:tripartite tricarboxylate transporter substrate-binding protein [Halobacillus dabanensis]SFJ80590.1 Tripartite-type tricarboxylate transporter, receptor component TctC [Halobacillus dabanensis]
MKNIAWMTFIVMTVLLLSACGSKSASGGDSENSIDQSRVRVVIGSSSTGGDTYQNAEAVSRYLEDGLGTNMKVDAIGAVKAFDELSTAKDDGSTVMFFHDMAYLGVEYGSFKEENKLENWTIGPVVAINPGNAFLTSGDAPYDTLAESAEWLNENPEETITVAIQAGGVSEIVFDGYYLWAKEEFGTGVSDRINVYVTGSQEDKNQALWDGNADIIHGSIGSNSEYTKKGVEDKIKMKFLGVTASERVEGYDIPTMAEQGITVNGKEFTFDKEFFFLMPKEVDEEFATKLDQAVQEVVDMENYQEDLQKNAYITNYIPAKESTDYLLEKREEVNQIIEEAPDLDKIAQ